MRIGLPRVIMHVDLDAFYPSIEVRVNPRLKGLPVIVGADPKGGKGRGVVASCSYEARSRGVHSAQPISIAYRLCSNGVYLRPNLPLYRRVSESVMKILKRFADRFEQVGIDEAYLDVSSRVKDYVEAEALAYRVKREVFQREALTCSIGVASNKLLAKIASDLRKPDGLTMIEPHEAQAFLSPLKVNVIPGVGKKTEGELNKVGVKTVGDLATLSRERLVSMLGKHGLWLWNASHGIDESGVEERAEAKSISSETTFPEDVADRSEVRKALDELAEEVYRRVMAEGYLFRTVVLKIRFEDFETHTRARTLHEYLDSKEAISNNCKILLKEFNSDPRKVRLVGVRVSNLKRKLEKETLLSWAR